jgi:hypothetical protein
MYDRIIGQSELDSKWRTKERDRKEGRVRE